MGVHDPVAAAEQGRSAPLAEFRSPNDCTLAVRVSKTIRMKSAGLRCTGVKERSLTPDANFICVNSCLFFFSTFNSMRALSSQKDVLNGLSQMPTYVLV